MTDQVKAQGFPITYARHLPYILHAHDIGINMTSEMIDTDGLMNEDHSRITMQH